MRAVFLAAMMMMVALAGCLSDPAPKAPETDAGLTAEDISALLSAPLGNVTVLHEALDLATSLGDIRADVYRPDPASVPADWKAPVIVVASPYNGPSKDPDDDNRMALDLYAWMERVLLPRGYAIAHVDLLGTASSDGCTGVMDQAERRATAEAIDLLGEMEWSNGKVGMIGKSYVGASQIFAAIEGPEHLATIVPISPVTNAYAYHYRNGVPFLGNQLTNPLYFTYGNVAHATGLDDAIWGEARPGDLTTLAEDPPTGHDAACLPESWAQGANPLGDYTVRWAERDAGPHIPQMRSDIGVLFVHGHQDWNVKPDHFSDVWASYPSEIKMAMLGQWHHDYPDNNRWDPDTHGHREDWYWLLHRWFDHFLLDIDTGLAEEARACPVQSQSSDATWHCMHDFPPAPDGLLRLSAADGDYVYAERGLDLRTAGLAEEDTHVPNDRVRFAHTFTGEEHIVGIPTITLTVSTTSPYNAHLMVALEVDGTEIDWALQSLRHRNGLTGEPITPDTEYEVTIPFYMLDHVFETGDRLTIDIRGHSAEPNLGVAPNPVPGVVTVSSMVLDLPRLAERDVFEPFTMEVLPEHHHLPER